MKEMSFVVQYQYLSWSSALNDEQVEKSSSAASFHTTIIITELLIIIHYAENNKRKQSSVALSSTQRKLQYLNTKTSPQTNITASPSFTKWRKIRIFYYKSSIQKCLTKKFELLHKTTLKANGIIITFALFSQRLFFQFPVFLINIVILLWLCNL